MSVAAELPAGAGREQRFGRGAVAFGQPGAQDLDGQGQQRGVPLLAALAQATHVGSGAEDDVCAGQAGQLRDAQPGLDDECDHGVIAPAGPARRVAGGEQGVDLVVGEEGDQVALEDGQYPLDGRGVFGVVQRGVAEQ